MTRAKLLYSLVIGVSASSASLSALGDWAARIIAAGTDPDDFADPSVLYGSYQNSGSSGTDCSANPDGCASTFSRPCQSNADCPSGATCDTTMHVTP